MTSSPSLDRRAIATAIGSALVGAAVVVALLWNVEVQSDVVGTRGCGSGFDVLADRSGWETWWAADLAEPDPRARDELVRTTECPGATNRRLVAGTVLAVLGAAVAVVAIRSARPSTTRDRPLARLARLGRTTRSAGLALAISGTAALVVLAADSGSTLFLYVDRSVVVVVGLVALVPTLALAAIGHAMTAIADAMAATGRGETERVDNDPSETALTEDRTVER